MSSQEDHVKGSGTSESENPAKRGTPGLEVRAIPTIVRSLLVVSIALDAFVVFAMGLRDLAWTTTPWATLASVILLAIGGTCAWALLMIRLASRNWLMVTFTSQVFVAVLAGYIWLVDQRSPAPQTFGVAGVALIFGAVALMWALYLGRHANTSFTKSATAIVTLLPALGLVQFWMTTDYMPQSMRPEVDVETELTPTGATGSMIHLLAKVTMHNRGSSQADIPAAIMRVTAYPRLPSSQAPTPIAVAKGIDLSGESIGGDYRSKPTDARDAQLLYADDFVQSGSFMLPGMTIAYKKSVEIDSRTVQVARLTVSVAFVNHRRVSDTHTCFPPRVSVNTNREAFSKKVNELVEAGGAHYFCVEQQIEPTGTVQELVSDHPVMRVLIVINNPSEMRIEYPEIYVAYGTRRSIDNPSTDLGKVAVKIDNANPTSVFKNVSAEYSPSDTDVAPKKK